MRLHFVGPFCETMLSTTASSYHKDQLKRPTCTPVSQLRVTLICKREAAPSSSSLVCGHNFMPLALGPVPRGQSHVQVCFHLLVHLFHAVMSIVWCMRVQACVVRYIRAARVVHVLLYRICYRIMQAIHNRVAAVLSCPTNM
jgi:hypothetical protein